MPYTAPLTGSELIDCAKANGSKGIEVAASRCGYGEDLDAFEHALRQAGEHLGIEIHSFSDLSETPNTEENEAVEVAPESLSQL